MFRHRQGAGCTESRLYDQIYAISVKLSMLDNEIRDYVQHFNYNNVCYKLQRAMKMMY